MRQIIYNYIISQEKKRLKTVDIEKHVQDKIGLEKYWNNYGGYPSFSKSIDLLIQEGAIRPIKTWKQNGMVPALYNGYQVILQEGMLDDELIKTLSTQFHPKINVSYYFKHKVEFRQDKRYLEALNDFLRANPDLNKLPNITVNERSFQIFYDEKWLLSKHGHNFLQRIGLTLEDMSCYLTYEPFFYYQRKNRDSQEVNALIVENKDTFFSLKELLQKDINTWGKTPFALLIYGEGRKIEKSFSFFWELDEYKDCKVKFYYFGDLDPEGISIWFDLQRKSKVDIKPFVFFYNRLLEKYLQVAQPIKKDQKVSAEAIQAFLSYLPDDSAKSISKMLSSKRYLPQEGLNLQLLIEFSD